MSKIVPRLEVVVIDCHDPERLAAFWAAVFDTEEEWRSGDPVQYIDLRRTESAPTLAFQRVPEPKSGKNRVHFDLSVENIDAEAKRLVALGARPAPQGDVREHGFEWRVMLDPEGNEFCLVVQNKE